MKWWSNRGKCTATGVKNGKRKPQTPLMAIFAFRNEPTLFAKKPHVQFALRSTRLITFKLKWFFLYIRDTIIYILYKILFSTFIDTQENRRLKTLDFFLLLCCKCFAECSSHNNGLIVNIAFLLYIFFNLVCWTNLLFAVVSIHKYLNSLNPHKQIIRLS